MPRRIVNYGKPCKNGHTAVATDGSCLRCRAEQGEAGRPFVCLMNDGDAMPTRKLTIEFEPYEAPPDPEPVQCFICGAMEHYWFGTRAVDICGDCMRLYAGRTGIGWDGMTFDEREQLLLLHALATVLGKEAARVG